MADHWLPADDGCKVKEGLLAYMKEYFGNDGNVLELDSADGYTTLEIE